MFHAIASLFSVFDGGERRRERTYPPRNLALRTLHTQQLSHCRLEAPRARLEDKHWRLERYTSLYNAVLLDADFNLDRVQYLIGLIDELSVALSPADSRALSTPAAAQHAHVA